MEGPIGSLRVAAALEKTEDGRAVLAKFKIKQIISRIKYERKYLD